MTFISAVIIARNEEARIGECLRSLKTVADEIIVVDAQSTDNTALISKEAGAVVIVQEWLGYGAQKNVGHDAASHDYILSLDADEVLDEALIAAIRREKEKGLSGVYQLMRLNYYYGKFIRHGAEYPDRKIRLFDRRQCRWDNRLVHEELIIPPTEAVTVLKGYLLHYSYMRFEEHLVKINRYTTLAAENYFKAGRKPSVFKIIFSPWATFIQAYFFKRGFLDGLHGFVVATMHSYAVFARYFKLWEIHRSRR